MSEREFLAPIWPLLTIFVFILGTVVGSFLNVVIWRLPRGESLSHPGSHCPKCHHAIRPWENIPILSWAWLRGRCSHCGLAISARYPAVELVNGLLFFAIWYRVWFSGMALTSFWGYAFLVAALLAASFIDVEHLLIPDAITFSGMLVAVVLAGIFPATHLGTGITGLPGADQLITRGLLDTFGTLGERIYGLPRLAAIIDSVLGIVIGYTLLWLLLQAGRRLWGRTTEVPEKPVEALITAEGIRADEAEFDVSWDDILVQPTDAFEARISNLHPEDDNPPDAADREVTLEVKDGKLRIGQEVQDLEEVTPTRVVLSRWQYPREVMGLGDAKLLAMIGAFMGPDACVFVLMFGAFAGCAWGVTRLVGGRGRELLPFGPFLAGAALLWLLFGQTFVNAYGSWLTR